MEELEDLQEPLGRDAGALSRRLSPAAGDAIRRYGWQGNVRELRNVMERAVLRSGGNQSRAARLLGVSRDTLLYRMERYGPAE